MESLGWNGILKAGGASVYCQRQTLQEVRMRVSIAASLGLILFAPSLANAQPAAPKPACLRQDMVQGWDVVNDRTMIVTNRVGQKFTLSLRPGCHNLKFNLRLAFKAFGGTRLSCLGRNDYVLVPPGAGDVAQRCMIADVQPYSATTQPTGAAAPSK
jgi:hypothetical protein